MEEDQEFKHVCKFCSKRFPCGRSLGGHMRSHMVNEISAQSDGTKLTKKKLPPLTTVNGSTLINNNNKRISTETTGYGLRENPKKTWRLKDHPSEDNFDRFCEGCGKFFQSWKSHFDHMKCHFVEKERLLNVGILEEDQDSWTGCDNQKLVMDGTQSINETPAPNRRKRSKRRIRYMGTANSSSSSLSFPSNVSCSSEIDQEQEEVAMCLMMLSRDVGKWGGLNFLADSSDNNSVFLETNLVSSKTEGKNSDSEGFDTDKWKKVGENKSKIGKLELQDFRVEDGKTDFSASGISGKVGQVFRNDTIKNYELDNHYGIHNSEETGLNQGEMVSDICISIKRKFRGAPFHDPELTSKPLKKLRTNALDSEKNSKFECESCNKVFSSYQALGGHRASHKKIRSCLSSRIDNNGNTIDTGISPETPPRGDLIIKPTTNELPKHQFGTGNYDPEAETSHGPKRSKKHECPICLKVFPSGQALGGHKRSHLVSGIEPSIRIQEDSVPEIRGFLDLNLPAPVEEEANGFDHPWWTETSHTHETLIGLIT